jgi:hypothetical protein
MKWFSGLVVWWFGGLVADETDSKLLPFIFVV